MYGSASFVPQPMIWPGISPPDPEVGLKFYNPKQTEAGKNKLASFLTALSGVFDLVSSEEGDGVMSELESYNIPEGEALPLAEDHVDFTDLLNGSVNEGWVRNLLAAHESKKAIGNAHAAFGEKLDKFLNQLEKAGAYDIQLLLPLIKKINALSLAAPSASEAEINNLSDGQVTSCCDLLGISDDRGTLRDMINQMGQEIADLPKFDTDSLIETIRSVEVKAITPAIGMVGTNIIGKAIARTQEENYRIAEKQAKELEREKKKVEGKRAARHRELIKQDRAEMATRARSEKANNKKEGKK